MLFKVNDNLYECHDREIIDELLKDEEYNIIQITHTKAIVRGTGWWYQHFCMSEGFGGTVKKIF